MRRVLLLSIFSIGLLISCQDTSSKPNIVNKNADTLVSIQKQIDTGHNNYSQDDSAGNGCTRGKAEPIIKRTVFPKTSFQLQKDSLTGIETVELNSGDKIIIRNWGCEYYCLTFRFETGRFQSDTTDLKYWFDKTTVLMDEVQKGIDGDLANAIIKQGIESLKKNYKISATDNYQNLKLKDEIDCDENEIREFLTVDRVEKLANNRYAVEVSFCIGPL